MVCDRDVARPSRVRNLAQETEQFSFIETLSVSTNHPESGLPNHTTTSPAEQSSALSESTTPKTAQQASSALALGNNSPLTIAPNWIGTDNSSQENFQATGGSLSNVIVIPVSELNSQENPHKSWVRYLDKTILVAATLYLGCVFWWIFGSGNALFALPWLDQQQVSPEDAEFIDYMQQSLELIDRQTRSLAKASNSTDKTEANVFVPIYTPRSAPKPTPSFPTASLPTLLPPPPPSQLAALNPPVSATPIATPPAPRPSKQSATTPTITTPKVSRRNVSTETKTQTPASNQIAATTRAHSLVGVMELSENSAALFKVGGVTHRIWLGEKITNTDWVLKSVSEQQVTIDDGASTRTLTVGDIF